MHLHGQNETERSQIREIQYIAALEQIETLTHELMTWRRSFLDLQRECSAAIDLVSSLRNKLDDEQRVSSEDIDDLRSRLQEARDTSQRLRDIVMYNGRNAEDWYTAYKRELAERMRNLAHTKRLEDENAALQGQINQIKQFIADRIQSAGEFAESVHNWSDQ